MCVREGRHMCQGGGGMCERGFHVGGGEGSMLEGERGPCWRGRGASVSGRGWLVCQGGGGMCERGFHVRGEGGSMLEGEGGHMCQGGGRYV